MFNKKPTSQNQIQTLQNSNQNPQNKKTLISPPDPKLHHQIFHHNTPKALLQTQKYPKTKTLFKNQNFQRQTSKPQKLQLYATLWTQKTPNSSYFILLLKPAFALAPTQTSHYPRQIRSNHKSTIFSSAQ